MYNTMHVHSLHALPNISKGRSYTCMSCYCRVYMMLYHSPEYKRPIGMELIFSTAAVKAIYYYLMKNRRKAQREKVCVCVCVCVCVV